LLSQIAVAPVNHVLRGESWALRRLQPYAGKTARFEVPPFSLEFSVREDGEVAPPAPGVVPDATFRLTPPAALRILAGDRSAYEQVAVSGDAEFAKAVESVVRNARWDAEEDLSRLMGDAAAHRIVRTGRSVARLPVRMAQSMASNLSDYWIEERPLIARRADVQDFVLDVDALRDDVERLAQRISRLEAK